MVRKTESGMEYLTVYGWSILIMATVVVALVLLGVFDPGVFLSQECIMPVGLECVSAFLSPSGVLSINLMQTTLAPINVTALGCNSNGTISDMQAPYNPPLNQVEIPTGANYTFSVQCYSGGKPFSGSVGTLFSGYLLVNYTDTSTDFPYIAPGKIIIKVS